MLEKKQNTFITCLSSKILNNKNKWLKSLNVIRHFAEIEHQFYDSSVEL
jgi:hypothetical protein